MGEAGGFLVGRRSSAPIGKSAEILAAFLFPGHGNSRQLYPVQFNSTSFLHLANCFFVHLDSASKPSF